MTTCAQPVQCSYCGVVFEYERAPTRSAFASSGELVTTDPMCLKIKTQEVSVCVQQSLLLIGIHPHP
jgi:hypothetical protein